MNDRAECEAQTIWLCLIVHGEASPPSLSSPSLSGIFDSAFSRVLLSSVKNLSSLLKSLPVVSTVLFSGQHSHVAEGEGRPPQFCTSNQSTRSKTTEERGRQELAIRPFDYSSTCGCARRSNPAVKFFVDHYGDNITFP